MIDTQAVAAVPINFTWIFWMVLRWLCPASYCAMPVFQSAYSNDYCRRIGGRLLPVAAKSASADFCFAIS